MINKDEEVKNIIEMLVVLVSMRNSMGSEVKPNDFDYWISGYFAGRSLNNKDLNAEIIKEVVDKVIQEDFVKNVIGISGTLEEEFMVVEKK